MKPSAFAVFPGESNEKWVRFRREELPAERLGSYTRWRISILAPHRVSDGAFTCQYCLNIPFMVSPHRHNRRGTENITCEFEKSKKEIGGDVDLLIQV